MASDAVTKLYASVLDQVGRLAKTAIQISLDQYNPTTGTAAAFKAILVALINPGSKVVKLSTSLATPIGTSASGGARAQRQDKVTLDLSDSNGVIHTFRVPTPSADLGITAGADSINIANALVTSWASAMVAHACTADGVAYVGGCTGGRYIRHKTEKKGGY